MSCDTSNTMKRSLFNAEFIKTPTPHTLTFYALLGSVIGGEKKKCVANPTECCGNHPQYVSVFLIHYPAEIHMPFNRPYKDLIQTSKSDPRSTLSKEYRYQNSGLKDLKKKVETFDPFQSGGLDDEDASSTRPAILAPKGLVLMSFLHPMPRTSREISLRKKILDISFPNVDFALSPNDEVTIDHGA